MSIKYEGKSWCYVDEEHFLNESFTNVLDCSHFRRYVCNPNMFNITQQYLYDSQYIKSVTPNTIGKKRKRRRNEEYSEIELLIQSQIKELTNVCCKDEFVVTESHDNNINARNLQNIVNNMQIDLSLDENISERDAINDIKSITDLDLNRVTSCLVSNPHNVSLLKEINLEKFLIPPKSTFQMSDITGVETLLDAGVLFDCIVMDPPWQNKSVKRKRVYNSMPMFDLKMIPITKLCNEDCLVVVWVTNKTKLQDYIINELFPSWKITFESEWYWVKVTKSFVPVLLLNSHHKKPYEKLIVGRYHGLNYGHLKNVPEIPKEMTIISVPSSIHSHKPPLTNVVTKYLPKDAKCLELFARNLLPGWYSWGNQVLLLQNERLFNDSTSHHDNEDV